MTNADPFLFGSPAYDTSRVFCARLGGDINTQEQLFQALYYLLRFPNYFGFNWNALFDCLKDLHWIKERVVVLVHDGLPKLPDEDLKIYLEIMRDAVIAWNATDEHQLEIIFAESDRDRVMQILNS